MGISAPLRASPFFGGSSSTSDLVPFRFPVSIDGRPYMVDTKMGNEWRQETVPLLRQQSDDSAQPGEQSLNPEAPWRRPSSSWHKGAGQAHRDRADSVPFRFQESRGVDVWDRYQLSLLPAVDQKRTTSSTNLKLVPCGNRLFLMDGASVVYTENVTVGSPTWADCSNEPGGALKDICSDGRYVWITDGSNIYQADGTASPPDFGMSAWEDTDADVLAYVKGYLLSAHGDDINYHAADGTATAVGLATGAVTAGGFTFVGFTGGPSSDSIYAAGYAGDKSLIFRIGITDDGSGLDVAVPAAELPDGEVVRAIGSYLGVVLIGTDEGVRFASPDGNGLTVGALLETGSPCRCFEGQGPFVWFGWDEFVDDDVFFLGVDWHGLGRLSLEEFSSTDRLAPAFATDLMDRSDGAVTSVVSFQGRRVWTTAGTDLGVFAEEESAGASGYLITGLTDFGFTGDKTATGVDVTFENPADGRIGVQVEADDTGESSEVAVLDVAGSGTTSFGAGSLRASRFNLAVAMTSTGVSPTVSSFVLKGIPAVRSSRVFQIPLLFNESLDPDGGVAHFDVGYERTVIEGLWESQQVVTVQELDRTFSATVRDFTWLPRMRGDAAEGFAVDGTMLVQLKEVA